MWQTAPAVDSKMTLAHSTQPLLHLKTSRQQPSPYKQTSPRQMHAYLLPPPPAPAPRHALFPCFVLIVAATITSWLYCCSFAHAAMPRQLWLRRTLT
jgi:hypothetical protein